MIYAVLWAEMAQKRKGSEELKTGSSVRLLLSFLSCWCPILNSRGAGSESALESETRRIDG